ncbi:MAG TPA: nuclear transport factor 2 family protein [Pseudonocardia sp.]
MSTPAVRPDTANETAIRDLVGRADLAQKDPDALLALHTDGAVVVNIAGRRVWGRAAFAEAMNAAMTSPLQSIRTSIEVVDVRLISPEVALVSCTKTVHDGRADTDRTPLPSTGALTYVLVREAVGWRIALAQTTPIAR